MGASAKADRAVVPSGPSQQAVSAVPASIPSARVTWAERDDVLYVSLFDPPRPAVTYVADCEVCFRFEGDEFVGVTIVGLAAQAIEARRAETGTGSVKDESAVVEDHAP